MNKLSVGAMVAFFLAMSGIWAQTAQVPMGKRVHTRPPYSGPRKTLGKSHPHPTLKGKKMGGFKKDPSSHIMVR